MDLAFDFLPPLPASPARSGPVAAVVTRPVFDPMLSVGHQLMQAREARSLSIEDVAFATRVPHQRLRDMENDDLSNFANLTYAKGFLKIYSRYLDLDLSDYLDEFDTSAVSDATGHEYAHSVNASTRYIPPAIAPDQSRFTSASSLLTLGGLAIIIIGTGVVLLKAPREHPSDTLPTAKAVAPARPSGPPTIIAKAEPVAPPGAVSTGSSSPNPVAPTAQDSIIRKALPVDDDGNEIAPRR
jgi:cytoskeletal protein RodZ